VPEDFVEISNQEICRGSTVTLSQGTFRRKLRLGDWMRFEPVVAGTTESLSGMVVNLDNDTVEIDVPYEQPRA
jgi:hypothetical protein